MVGFLPVATGASPARFLRDHGTIMHLERFMEGSPTRPIRTKHLLGAILLGGLIAPRSAAAYLDPLSGSIVVQVVVAALLGAAVGVRQSWQRIRRAALRLIGRGQE